MAALLDVRNLEKSFGGVVAAVGPDARGVKVGDRRVVFPWIGCGECALCAAGNEQLCGAPRALGLGLQLQRVAQLVQFREALHRVGAGAARRRQAPQPSWDSR